MKLEARPIDIPQPKLVRVTQRSAFPGATPTPIDEVVYEAPSVPACGYYAVWYLDGAPVSPEEATEAVLDGAELVTDLQEANRIVQEVLCAARLASESTRYGLPIVAWSRLEHHRLVNETLAVAGLDGDKVIDPGAVLLTTAEVAQIFRVDEQTVRAWEGSRLPASVRVGRRHLFRASAILRLLGDPGQIPARPRPKPQTKPRPKAKAA